MHLGDALPPGGHRPTTGQELAPGGPEARAQGCCCSVLANAGHRVGTGAAPLFAPHCDLHGVPGQP